MVDRNAEFRETILAYAKRDPEGMADMYIRLRAELVHPPEGWFNFGHHAGLDHDCLDTINLEWWGIADDGMPIWERIVPDSD